MDISQAPTRSISSVSFQFYSRQEILKLSVQKIVNPQLHDSANHPTAGGLYDGALGPVDKNSV